MKIVTIAARLLMGLIFLVFGLNGFLHFLPPPAPGSMPQGAMDFFGAMMKTGYMIKLAMGTQVAAAVLLLGNRFVPLALALIAPVIVNIICFHVFLDPGLAAMAPGLFVLACELYLAWAYRRCFAPMLAARAVPS